MIKKILNCYIIILLIVLILVPNILLAQDTVMPGSGGNNYNNCKGDNPCSSYKNNKDQYAACKQYCGEYEVNDFVALGVHISQIILGIVGSLALLAFVVGGVMFLASGGNKNLVDRGKATIIGAVIGLVVVFASYTIISFAASAMGIDINAKNIFNSSWFTN